MIKIGLTGGIASGKSTVSDYLNNKYGVPIIDADKIAYELAEPGKGIWQGYVDRYGKEKALFPGGTLNRRAIADIVFSKPEEKAWMDSMAIPLVKAETERRISQYEKDGLMAVVLDVPLMIEQEWNKMVDSLWVVYVNPQTQLERLMKRNGYDVETAEKRVASQMSLEKKKKMADIVIDNSNAISDSQRQVDEAWKKLTLQEE